VASRLTAMNPGCAASIRFFPEFWNGKAESPTFRWFPLIGGDPTRWSYNGFHETGGGVGRPEGAD